jgi:type IV pilus assembly protein PilW
VEFGWKAVVMVLPGVIEMDFQRRISKNKCGFTLVELMLVVAISSIVMGAIYSAYISQNRTYIAQESVAEMQQNIRVGLGMLERDIRMAAYDSTRSNNFGFVNNVNFSNGAALTENVITSNNGLAFTMDLNEDGVIDQAVVDIDGNGNKDMTEMEQVAYRLNGTDLQRYSTTTGIIEWQTMAEGIENIEFNFILDNGTQTTNPGAADLLDIRAIQISILAVASRPDQNFTNTMTYTTASGATWDPVDDNLRRRLLITTVQCRNMGL